LSDVSTKTGDWNNTGFYCGGADMNGSGAVDFADFAIFTQHWLEGL
jgi:hypothetical protein